MSTRVHPTTQTTASTYILTSLVVGNPPVSIPQLPKPHEAENPPDHPYYTASNPTFRSSSLSPRSHTLCLTIATATTHFLVLPADYCQLWRPLHTRL